MLATLLRAVEGLNPSREGSPGVDPERFEGGGGANPDEWEQIFNGPFRSEWEEKYQGRFDFTVVQNRCLCFSPAVYHEIRGLFRDLFPGSHGYTASEAGVVQHIEVAGIDLRVDPCRAAFCVVEVAWRTRGSREYLVDKFYCRDIAVLRDVLSNAWDRLCAWRDVTMPALASRTSLRADAQMPSGFNPFMESRTRAVSVFARVSLRPGAVCVVRVDTLTEFGRARYAASVDDVVSEFH